MHIIKPHWPLHCDDKDRPTTIFTLSVHPDQSRVATGGLDTKIKIWSTAPILRKEVEENEKVPRLLCTMTSHAGVVMCIRWSTTGRYLASGSDDNIVMIWALESGTGGKVWGSNETNVENWKAVKRLVGHDSDVSGVAWNYDDSYLASVGFDSSVLIWSGINFDLVRRLDGHQGFVKGVVFDPVGQYLATQSDDNTVKIWRTQDWRLEANIETPFKNSPKTATTRLSWSPEGAHIVTPNSMNGPVFVAAVIDRLNFKSDHSMVGHENIVEVTAFSPIVFLRDPNGSKSGSNLCTLLALSASSSISLWLTSSSQPLLVLDDVFDRNVLDMSWSNDGTQLWTCSSEGHVCVFTFSLSELGHPAPPGTKELYHKTYGFQRLPSHAPSRVLSQSNSFAGSGSLGGMGTMVRPNVLAARRGPGAKRIVPVSAPAPPPQQHLFQPPMEMYQHQNQTRHTVEPRDSVPWGSEALIAESARKKRTAGNGVMGGRDRGRTRDDPNSSDEDEDLYAAGPSNPFAHHPSARVSQAPYRTKGYSIGQGSRKPDLLLGEEPREVRPAYLPRERVDTFVITNRDNGEKGKVRCLAVPQVMSFGRCRVVDEEEGDTFEWRNFDRGDGDLKAGTSEVAVVTQTKTLWVDYLPKFVVCATGSPQFVAVSTEEGALVAWSPTGRRILPTIILDSPCSHLTASASLLLAITSLGTLHVFSTQTASSLFPSLSLSPLLTASATRSVPHPTITTAALLPNGAPLIALSSGSTCVWDKSLGAWTRVGETWFASGSDFWDGGRGVGGTVGTVKAVERGISELVVNSISVEDENETEDDAEGEEGGERKRRKIHPVGEARTRIGSPPLQRTAISLAHLEVRMKAAVTLESPVEYKGFLIVYAKRLAEEGFRNKAEELVKELLGPIYFKPGKEQPWEDSVLGFKKRDLLRDVLREFAKSRLLGGLGSEYQDILKKVSAA